MNSKSAVQTQIKCLYSVEMAFWLLILLQICTFAESRLTSQVNQGNLYQAMYDMRIKSYHGFVILLKIFNTSLNTPEITFLMPNDQQLSQAALTQENIQEFILSHSIPMPLLMSNLLLFPNGTLVPTTAPDKMISIMNDGPVGLFVNNAKIVSPNVCVGPFIRCHGISDTLVFNGLKSSPVHSTQNLGSKELTRLTRQSQAKSMARAQAKRTTLHR